MPMLFGGLAVLAGAVTISLAARYGYRAADTVVDGVIRAVALLARACPVSNWYSLVLVGRRRLPERTSAATSVTMGTGHPGTARALLEMGVGLNNVHEQQKFIKWLTETICWCRGAGSLLDSRKSLRACKPNQSDLNSQHHQVFSVSLERSRRLWSLGQRNLQPTASLCGGRLLAYFPDDNLADGVAEAETNGFFDVNNIPPYDTWVWMVRNIRTFKYADGAEGEMDANYLVAWVPPDFVPLASAGIKVNPENCILWLDTMDDEFVRSLRRLKLLE